MNLKNVVSLVVAFAAGHITFVFIGVINYTLKVNGIANNFMEWAIASIISISMVVFLLLFIFTTERRK